MHERFIARQPIFDKRLRVFAYELLFRGGPQNFFQASPNASSSVIADAISLHDLQMLTGHARAFVNVDELALRLGAPRLLPADRIVVEILETVKPTDEIVKPAETFAPQAISSLSMISSIRRKWSRWSISRSFSRSISSCWMQTSANASPKNTAATTFPC